MTEIDVACFFVVVVIGVECAFFRWSVFFRCDGSTTLGVRQARNLRDFCVLQIPLQTATHKNQVSPQG